MRINICSALITKSQYETLKRDFFREGGRGEPPYPPTIKKPGRQGKPFLKDLLTGAKKSNSLFSR